MARMTDRDIQATGAAPESGVLRFPSPAAFPATATAEDILAALYATWWAPLCAYARKRNPEEADDIVEDAFIELWNKHLAHGRRPAAGCEAVLMAAVRFRCADRRRESIRRELAIQAKNYATLFALTVRNWMLPSHRFDSADFARLVNEALDDMTPRCRELQWLHRDAGMTVTEIATSLQISTETVSSLLQKGNRIIRRRLEKAGYSPEGRRAAAKMREIA
jgi:RNA polymerase sigma factor (sigma-70 family)